MKRDRRLRDLSDDHHHALVLARRATEAATDVETVRVRVWAEVVHRFDEELAPHFAIEERYLLPMLDQGCHAELIKRTRDEHTALRELVSDDHQDLASRLVNFGNLLREHVRFEERVLFMVIQDIDDHDGLEAVAAACARKECGR